MFGERTTNFVGLCKATSDIMSFVSVSLSLSEGGRERDKAEEESELLVVLSFSEPSLPPF